LPYQPAIDGLRAIAVTAVVLYHFGLPFLPGGFTGVDVFFVISGYLIGGLLWAEAQATGRIALGRFYMRRIRRLAPAFFAMALVSLLAAWFILLPFEFREFGKELVAATLWLSNVLFYQGAGYFDIGADSKVLLHTWSLSVEEQFYLVLPLTLSVMLRFPRLTVPALAALWALSLLASVLLTPTQPNATFYLFPFRAWELLSGVLLAIALQGRHWRSHPALSLLGLLLVLGGVVLITPAGFPGWLAIVPVAGAVCLLAGIAADNPVNRALRLPPVVFLGLISYSLYLWHWPVLILSRYWRGAYSGPFETALWLAIAVVLAITSWALVERPLRRASSPGPRALLAGFVGLGALSVALGLLLWQRNGLPERFGPEVRAQIAASQDFLQDWSRCTVPTDGPFTGIETCAIGPDGPARVIIWGDSHLRALMDGLAVAGVEANVPGLIIWHAGCPPLFGLVTTESAATAAQDAACTAANRQMQAVLTGPDAPERLIIVGRWAYYAEGTGVGVDAGNTITLAADPAGPLLGDPYPAAWAYTIATLAPHIPQIAVFRQVPELPHYRSRDVARGLAHGRLTLADAQALMTVDDATLLARTARAEAPILGMAQAGLVRLIDPLPLICAPDCRADPDGVIWYFDNNHLTNRGALALRGLFLPAMTGAE
jgi:peptidoglycan/LPS O-acetylase OafA/YrhL